MAASTIAEEILELERRFWEAMRTSDGAAAAGLTAEACILVGAQGASTIRPADLAAMMEHSPWALERYSIDDSTVQVKTIDSDSAIIAYTVTEHLTVEGKPVTLKASDSSVWVRRDGKWLCALHTESITGDPYGRDRRPDS